MKRAALNPVGDKPEEYDEQAGTGATGSRFRIRRRGWDKAPFGHGHTCPECRVNVSQWVHTGAHDVWHRQVDEGFNTLDNARDEDRALVDQLHGEVAELRAELAGVQRQCHNFAVILGEERAREGAS